MVSKSKRGSMSYEVERTMRTIFKRCVQCPPETPTCGSCPNGQICSLVPQNCIDCAHTECIANPNPSPKSDSPNVGAIAGGVIGGVVFMSVVMFLLWRFWIKKRREQQELEAVEWEEDDIAQQKGDVRRFTAMRSDAASTRTRGSVAASILSRASNIIQIAYIPGVTNRNGSGHNSLLAQAPVPPIPAAYANTTPKSPLSNEGDALFFRPDDLRGSTYSESSSLRSADKRDTQYTRQSITPSLARSSMMSDVYMDDSAPPPMPATQVIRAAPKMVSVKGSSATSSPSLESPPTAAQLGPKVMMPGQVSSTSSPSSGSSGFVKAKPVTIGGSKGKGRFPVSRQPSDASTATSTSTKPAVPSPLVETADVSDDEDEHARARKSMIRNSLGYAADPTPLIQPLESPFFDASETQTSASAATQQRPNPYAAMSASVGSGRRVMRSGDNRGPGGLSAVIEEAAKRASETPDHEGFGGKRDQSPFGDEHATKDQ
ncbi:hypothetical protein AC579_1358 [Pseudocercospora musae]|uniref:Membrane anchor Opy2 N-terminal domain-containing protein n=1 Tax=Pseudocercospora musae TaxID=113226 RepID=A0A139IKH8_9PEZI|nr:hypothetical protein AC579_1358 [Pseudocercospora musae]